MRILVTGAAGFLGSHLTDRLLGERHSVIGVDNFSTGSAENLAHLKHEPRFEFQEKDICEPFDPGPVGYVFNMASPASPPEYLRLPLQTLRVGSAGTENTLSIAARYGAGYLHASTSECYGEPLQHPQHEDHWGNVNPVGPRSVYDEAKRFSEALVMAYHRARGVNTHLARIFNTYGPRLRPDDGRVVSNLLVQALRNQPLTIYGDGRQTRSFCYVDDLIEGLVRLSRSEEHLPVNLGNPSEFTILECARAVIEVTGSNSEFCFLPRPADDPTRRCPDISKARGLLRWEPRITLKEGLTRTVESYKKSIHHDREQQGNERHGAYARNKTPAVPLASLQSDQQRACQEPREKRNSQVHKHAAGDLAHRDVHHGALQPEPAGQDCDENPGIDAVEEDLKQRVKGNQPGNLPLARSESRR
jgi:dTDP-glucose 4,6-dehydratase